MALNLVFASTGILMILSMCSVNNAITHALLAKHLQLGVSHVQAKLILSASITLVFKSNVRVLRVTMILGMRYAVFVIIHAANALPSEVRIVRFVSQKVRGLSSLLENAYVMTDMLIWGTESVLNVIPHV